jgi:hypothetical protein
MVLLVVLKKKDKMRKRKGRDVRTIATTAAVTTFVIILVATGATTGIIVTLAALHPVYAVLLAIEGGITGRHPTGAPSVITDENVYIAWWNGTAGEPDIQTDVMFRASNDAGATFSDKINLSNSPDADSWRAEIAGEGDNVVVSWWETNQTSDTPVARVSNDGGETFGPLLMLGSNGTLGSTEDETTTTAIAEGREAQEQQD